VAVVEGAAGAIVGPAVDSGDGPDVVLGAAVLAGKAVDGVASTVVDVEPDTTRSGGSVWRDGTPAIAIPRPTPTTMMRSSRPRGRRTTSIYRS